MSAADKKIRVKRVYACQLQLKKSLPGPLNQRGHDQLLVQSSILCSSIKIRHVLFAIITAPMDPASIQPCKIGQQLQQRCLLFLRPGVAFAWIITDVCNADAVRIVHVAVPPRLRRRPTSAAAAVWIHQVMKSFLGRIRRGGAEPCQPVHDDVVDVAHLQSRILTSTKVQQSRTRTKSGGDTREVGVGRFLTVFAQRAYTRSRDLQVGSGQELP